MLALRLSYLVLHQYPVLEGDGEGEWESRGQTHNDGVPWIRMNPADWRAGSGALGAPERMRSPWTVSRERRLMLSQVSPSRIDRGGIRAGT
jgi:hypothetical protein